MSLFFWNGTAAAGHQRQPCGFITVPQQSAAGLSGVKFWAAVCRWWWRLLWRLWVVAFRAHQHQSAAGRGESASLWESGQHTVQCDNDGYSSQYLFFLHVELGCSRAMPSGQVEMFWAESQQRLTSLWVNNRSLYRRLAVRIRFHGFTAGYGDSQRLRIKDVIVWKCKGLCRKWVILSYKLTLYQQWTEAQN